MSRLDMDHPLDGYEIRPCRYGVLENSGHTETLPEDAKGRQTEKVDLMVNFIEFVRPGQK
ncbi:hypothetical protein D3C76_1826210 [compost metagenome]